jgi:hypothetical protein
MSDRVTDVDVIINIVHNGTLDSSRLLLFIMAIGITPLIL